MASGLSSLRIGEAPTLEQQRRPCPQCSRVISPADTILVRSGRPVHLDCKWPHVLSPEERATLFTYCLDHVVARCTTCAHSLSFSQLSSDLLGGRQHLCPQCRRDLTESIRMHLHDCPTLPAELRRRAAALREAARNLVKQSQQLRDNADVLLREAEMLFQESQWALRRSLRGRVASPRGQRN